ncbi:MAG TPA: glutaredoxin family protein [Syntrophorhabdaceae bacterium]|nr:glutaredoxin family protein [Syntrophorhabdaceae bacterium]HNT67695.1 glutaredoxin family protein [Syntrophorhabdaceae bacterium]
MGIQHVDGDRKANLMLYTLSTCIWCKRTKLFLQQQGIGYDYIDVDSLEGDEKEKTLEEIRRWNPRCSFPSLVVNGERCVVGFDEDKIREAVGL